MYENLEYQMVAALFVTFLPGFFMLGLAWMIQFGNPFIKYDKE